MKLTARVAVLGALFFAHTQAQAALTIPVYESFDGVDLNESYSQVAGSREFASLPGWTAETAAESRIAFRSDFTIDGARPGNILSMDNPGGGGVNNVIMTMDASALTVANDTLMLSFNWYDHGDEGDVTDAVSVRGSDADPWLEIYSFAANSNNGAWSTVTNLDISTLLSENAQEFSTTSQIRFSQTDNFPINTDGISLDNVFVELAQPKTVSPAPATLTADMVNYTKKDIPVGDLVEYLIRVRNPSDGGASATNVVFNLDSLPPELSLPGSSVFTSKGSVVTGNTEGDTSVSVSLGDLVDGEVATIYIRATVGFAGSYPFYAQGTVSADGITAFLTDDSFDATGFDDATYARIFAFLSDLAITRKTPRKLTQSFLTVTPSPSSEPVVFGTTTPSVCVVNENIVTFIEEGECTVTADQEGDEEYPTAERIELTVTVKPQQVLTKTVVKKEKEDFLGSSSIAMLLMLAMAGVMRSRKR